MRRQGTTGVQSHFTALEHGLRSQGVNVGFINSFSYYRPLYYPLYAVRPLLLARAAPSLGVWWYRYWHFLFLQLALRKHLQQNPPDIINAQCPLSALAALRVRTDMGHRFKVVLTCHFNLSQAEEFRGKGEIKNDGRLYRSIVDLERFVLHNVDGVVFVSEFARNNIAAFLGNKFSSSAVIHNGIAPAGSSHHDLRTELGIDPKAFIIVSVGTLEPRKNQVFLVAVMKELLKTDRSIVLLLVGDGQDRQRIKAESHRAGCGQNIRLLGFRSDVRGLLAASDLYCHPALMESFGISIVESYAAGLPVIASPVGGIPEIVQHGKTGFLILPTDTGARAYADQILELRSNRSLYDSIAQNGRARYLAEFTEQKMSERYLAYYTQLVSSTTQESR
jgi:glycosyltransferase involved in cell wall biosynthesis